MNQAMSVVPHSRSQSIAGEDKQPFVIMLVPACNEERHIDATLVSLNRQTRRPDETIVILNNSTDRTGEIATAMIPNFPGLKVLTMAENTAKKAGALNYAMRTIMLTNHTIVGEMDADTLVADNIIEDGLKELADNPRLGGLCSRCGVKRFDECGERKPGKSSSRWEYLVWLMQTIEYGMTDARRADTSGNVKVMAGAFTLYTAEALRRVCRIRSTDGLIMVYDDSSEVEDYVLTLDVRSVGLQALAGQTMRSWTDVPVTLFGRQGLASQRLRWYRGSAVEIMKRRLQPEIRNHVGLEALQLFLSISRLIAFTVMGFILLSPSYGIDWTLFSVFILVSMFVFNWALYVPTLKYIEHVPPLLRLLPLTIVPMQIYSVWDDFVLYVSYVQSVTNRHRRW